MLLFIPNEGIYSFIHEHDTQLVDVALSQNVVLCSPFTLFSVLAVIRQAVDAFLVERTSDQILECLAGFGAQWGKFSDAVDLLGRRFESTQKAYDDLAGVASAPTAEAPRSGRLAARRAGPRARCSTTVVELEPISSTRRRLDGRRGSARPAGRLGPLAWSSTLGGSTMSSSDRVAIPSTIIRCSPT